MKNKIPCFRQLTPPPPIQFVSNEQERDLWDKHVLPKIEACKGKGKVREARWVQIPETASFVLAETHNEGATEALLSFWSELFMERTTDKQVPRYIFRVQGHSDLIGRFVEMERQYRMADSSPLTSTTATA